MTQAEYIAALREKLVNIADRFRENEEEFTHKPNSYELILANEIDALLAVKPDDTVRISINGQAFSFSGTGDKSIEFRFTQEGSGGGGVSSGAPMLPLPIAQTGGGKPAPDVKRPKCSVHPLSRCPHPRLCEINGCRGLEVASLAARRS